MDQAGAASYVPWKLPATASEVAASVSALPRCIPIYPHPPQTRGPVGKVPRAGTGHLSREGTCLPGSNRAGILGLVGQLAASWLGLPGKCRKKCLHEELA